MSSSAAARSDRDCMADIMSGAGEIERRDERRCLNNALPPACADGRRAQGALHSAVAQSDNTGGRDGVALATVLKIKRSRHSSSRILGSTVWWCVPSH